MPTEVAIYDPKTLGYLLYCETGNRRLFTVLSRERDAADLAKFGRADSANSDTAEPANIF